MTKNRLVHFAFAAVLCTSSLFAQTPAPTFEERLAAKAAESRHAVRFKDGGFSGPGWDLLVREGQASRFFLVGEEHGVAEIPAVVRELFRSLQPAGYRHLAIEISPPMATVLDGLAREGLPKVASFFQEYPPGVAFFTLKEEADLLVAARAAVDGKEPVLWGLDYEVTADRFLFDRMRAKAPAGPARAAAEALHEKSAAAWKTVSETKNPGAFFSFSMTPDVLAGLRQAWPNPDAESALALDVIEETLAINQLFVTNQGWESNERRAQLNRRNFLRHWNQVKASAPRVMFKFGASHMIRGRNVTEVFDLGNLASEMAAAEGGKSFHLLVIGGPGTEHAVFNPMELRYVPAPVDLADEEGLGPIVGQPFPEGFTLIDLRPLRPLFSAARTKKSDPELMRIVHGFDAILVLTGSRPSQTM